MPLDRLPDSIELEDAVLALTFGAGAAAVTGFASITIGQTALSDVFTTLGESYDITYAMGLAVASIIVAYLTNEPDFSDMNNEETYAVGAGLIVLLGTEYIDTIGSWVTGELWTSAIGFGLAIAAYMVIAYHGRGKRNRIFG